MSKVIIIGGHGKVALLLAPLLVANGDDVHSVVRNPDHVPDIRATGAEPIVADIENLGTEELTELISGHDAVVWSAGAGGGSPDRTWAVDRDAAIRSIDAAQAAGVQRYVMLSYAGSGVDDIPESEGFYAYSKAKAAADDHLRASGLQWTVLGPSGLTLDEPTGAIHLHDGTASGTVTRADVAAVIAQSLRQPATIGKTIRFDNGDVSIDEALASQ
ncbi:SDR family oxidoreductase [Parenemella sanctibonifatiensis]|uniref:NAD-dependent dehydratase n=1 Tax=Parenemella sanctibonifatiensis TaxID=2016505 RepID=A0A255ELF6_9ACTN|nr:SDR family oxidoreductase [Parenemella sanctibonifatiensis]OYN90435.1 NAD-dependent dehydratase [Parenemella sanctibonifatiensis]